MLRDLPYARRGEVDLLADVYRPASTEAAPAVLLVHGGSWARGSRLRMAQIASAVAKHGFVAVNIEYRLAPEHPYPASLEDVLAAVCWVRRNAVRLGVDPQRIALWGYSAGGHLSALAGSRPEATNPGDACAADIARVQACVIGSAPTDLRRFGDIGPVREFLGGRPAEIPAVVEAASPVFAVHSESPPTFLYHGRDDWVVGVEHSRALRNALVAANVPVQLIETARGHLTQLVCPKETIVEALAFLDRWLAPLPVVEKGREDP
ncbi:MAG: alpha/beta hydrolase [Planctomycetes bacterium]|nr:alpha/beta hydrolase [Planctomycetota bacterium]